MHHDGLVAHKKNASSADCVHVCRGGGRYWELATALSALSSRLRWWVPEGKQFLRVVTKYL